MVSENLRYELSENIGLLTLCGATGNLLPTPDFLSPETLSVILARDKPKGLIIHGMGRNFSAGADLKKLFSQGTDSSGLDSRMHRGAELLLMIENLDIPVIAAINGICFGGGLEIALACHIRIASCNALFAFPEVNLDLVPGLGGIERTAALTTKFNTLSLVLGGDMISAADALKMDIIDRIVPANSALDEALTMMKKMTSGRLLTVINAVMQTLNQSGKQPSENGYREEIRRFCSLAATAARHRNNEEQM